MATIQVSPFRLDAKPNQRGGFVMDFRGLTGKGVINVRLEFPVWWLEHITSKLATVRVGSGRRRRRH